MELSLTNYTTALPAPLLKKGAADTVRELDEVEKGRYQAYVDEKGGDTYDVGIVIDNKGVVMSHTCDCPAQPAVCRHKAAVLMAIAKGRKVPAPIKRKKKVTPVDAVLDDMDGDTLKHWVKDILTKNKDLEIAFLHQFSEQQKLYTPDDVKSLTQEAVKAVIRKKKTVEIGEIKKIIGLWTDIHEPIVAQYCSNVTDKTAFLNFNALVEAFETLQMHLKYANARFTKYIEKQLAVVGLHIYGLHDEAAWETATGYFIDYMFIQPGYVRPYYLSFLSAIPEGDAERKMRITEMLVQQYSECNLVQIYNRDIYAEIIFKLVVENDMFRAYYRHFKPGHLRNEYNEQLIRELIKICKLELAEQFCREQIRKNYKPEYNAIYQHLLKEVNIAKRSLS